MSKRNVYDEEAELEAEVDAALAEQAAPAAAGTVDQTQINQAILETLQTIADKQNNGPVPQQTYAQAVLPTPWNPTGKKNRLKMRAKFNLNGHDLRPVMHSEDEIERLNALKPGKYNGNKWAVWEKNDDTGNQTVYITIPQKTPDQKQDVMQLSRGNGLVGLLDVILAEQRAVTA